MAVPAWGWDPGSVSAIATAAAAIIALGIALIGWARGAWDNREKADSALVLLWPELRKCLAALESLKNHPVLTEAFDPLGDDQNTVGWIVEQFTVDTRIIETYVMQLRGSDAKRLTAIVAHSRHIGRHLFEIRRGRVELGSQKWTAKVKAIRHSMQAMRAPLAAAIRDSKAKMPT